VAKVIWNIPITPYPASFIQVDIDVTTQSGLECVLEFVVFLPLISRALGPADR
jgi:hypothetical protein